MSPAVPYSVRPVRFELADGTPVTVAKGVRLDGPLGELVREHAPEAFPAAPLADDVPPTDPGLDEAPTAPAPKAKRKTQK